MLDATAAGHLTAGETIADGVREVEEELGVRWRFDELTELGVFPIEDHPTPGTTNREFQHVYTVRDDRPLREWAAFDRAEVAGLVLMSPDGAIEWDGEHERAVTVDPAEIVPAPYLSALLPRRGS
jgi:ADP-ribose pyrophosphatase YjhB (NUDIX family)